VLILDSDRVELLIQRGIEYAQRRNLDVDQYLQGMFEPIMKDAASLDLAQMVESLLRYHQDWLRKA
jgi:hypothetical protein